jgi:hypothetical protein
VGHPETVLHAAVKSGQAVAYPPATYSLEIEDQAGRHAHSRSGLRVAYDVIAGTERQGRRHDRRTARLGTSLDGLVTAAH